MRPMQVFDPTKTTEKTIPIRWETWDLIDTMHIQFNHVEFLEHWGPFKVGDVFMCIDISLLSGEVCTYREGEESPSYRIRFNLQPIPDVST